MVGIGAIEPVSRGLGWCVAPREPMVRRDRRADASVRGARMLRAYVARLDNSCAVVNDILHIGGGAYANCLTWVYHVERWS